ncbi:hypothetical protein CC2G_008596 [Coprinopsis cinerea AmutBmut pab1-1]|nr:hypothetical protein CC2G_008596 [Coprinopsis cinerea AmutBmut pab1-1]
MCTIRNYCSAYYCEQIKEIDSDESTELEYQTFEITRPENQKRHTIVGFGTSTYEQIDPRFDTTGVSFPRLKPGQRRRASDSTTSSVSATGNSPNTSRRASWSRSRTHPDGLAALLTTLPESGSPREHFEVLVYKLKSEETVE